MAIIYGRVNIKGTRPLLWHHFTPEILQSQAGVRVERKGTKGNDPSEWKRTVLITKDRQLYLTGNYIYSCLRDAGRHTRSGRGSLQPMIAATLQVATDPVLIDRYLPQESELSHDPGAPVYLDVQMVRNPATRARNVRYRIAASPGWKAAFDLAWDGSVVSREQLAAVLADAGALVGLGDGRGIGFGRFLVTAFEVSETPQPAMRGRKRNSRPRAKL